MGRNERKAYELHLGDIDRIDLLVVIDPWGKNLDKEAGQRE
jgi:hypothetical protein